MEAKNAQENKNEMCIAASFEDLHFSNTNVTCNGGNVLLAVVGQSEELVRARQELTSEEGGGRLFLHYDVDHFVDAESEFEKELSQPNISDMIVFAAENSVALEQALLLSKCAKARGILSVVATQSKRWNAAEYLEEHALDMDNILVHADCLLLMPKAKTRDKGFYRHVGDFVANIENLVNDRGFINLDFFDVSAVLKDAGLAFAGSIVVSGRNSTQRAKKMADNEIIPRSILAEAKGVLVKVTGCTDIGLEEVEAATSLLQRDLSHDSLLIFGAAFDFNLRDEVYVDVLAAGFDL